MGCVSCHDPHEAVGPADRVAHYRDRCLRCHERVGGETPPNPRRVGGGQGQGGVPPPLTPGPNPRQRGCSLPADARRKKEPDDSCIACHMPRFAASDIAHVAASDHRIIRKLGEEPTNRGGSQAPPGLPLLDFYRGAPDLRDREAGRDLAVALYQLTLSGVPLSGPDGAFAVGLLSEALRECPGDLAAWEAKGMILQTIRRSEDAIEAFEALLKRAPRHEGALVALGTIHRNLERTDVALGYWRRAVEVNPWAAAYRRNLVLHLADQNAWEEIPPHCQKWLELDPASPEARHLWVACLLRAGRRAEARAEFAKLRALRPPNLRQLEAWFAQQTR
jgi:predicted CXXCH cytochrome family protein